MITSLTLLQLRALVAVVEEGGIGRAAARLDLAQSAVSQHVASLERSVGMSLLERRPGPVPATPTAAAEVLVEHARAILARVEVLQADVASMRGDQIGRVRLGCFMSVGARVLPRVLAEVATVEPAVGIELIERDADEGLLDDIASCAIDLAFVTLPLRPGPFEALELLRDPHVLIVPAGHPLAARREPPDAEELAALPLIGFRNDSSEERRLEGVLRAHGREPRIVLRTDNNLAIPELVAMGLGVAVVPRLALPATADDTRLRVIALAETTVPARRIGICWHSERRLGRAARVVRGIAQQICEDLAPGALG